MRLKAFFYGMGYLTLSGFRDPYIMIDKYNLTSSEAKVNSWLKWTNIGLVMTFVVAISSLIIMSVLMSLFGNVFLFLIIIPVLLLALCCYSQLRDWS